MELTEALKKIRKQYKMTQEDVAKFLGVSRSGYTYYETGKSLPSIEVLKKLSAIYDTTIDAIVGNPDRAKSSQSGKTIVAMEECADPLMYMKKEERELIMAYRLLNEDTKEELMRISLELFDKTKK